MKLEDIMWMSVVRCGGEASPEPFDQCLSTFDVVPDLDEEIVLPLGWTYVNNWFRCPSCSKKDQPLL